MAGRFVSQERVETAVAQTPSAIEQGFSNLIGGFLVFGLAAVGLAIGYASTSIQWATTGVLATTGSLLTVSGIWALVTRKPS